jgi:hypothetical protein
VLDQAGIGELALGYLGGVLDAATGLIYEYYDPVTGRFLSRGVNPGAPNPYVPWQGNPLGMIVGPLALLVLVRGKRKGGKVDQFLVILIVALAVSLSISGCGGGTSPSQPPSTPGGGESQDPNPTQPGGGGRDLTTPTPPSDNDPTPLPCPTPGVPTPTAEDIFRITKEDIAGAGGSMSSYLQQEDEALLMARIAMGEATDNSDERLRIMWLIKIQAELGYMNANARGRDLFYIDHYGQKSTIRNELLKDSKQFQVVDAALPVLDPERDTYLANLPHIKAMLYPNDNQVEEFKTLYSNAKLILTIQEDGLKTSTDPQLNQIRGYDEYRAYAITKRDRKSVV